MLDCLEQNRIKLKCGQAALETIIEITIKIQLQHGIFKGVTKTVFLSYKTRAYHVEKRGNYSNTRPFTCEQSYFHI